MLFRVRGKPSFNIDHGHIYFRLGDFLHFGQQFKAFGNNKFAQISYILSQFCKGVKIIQFSSEIIFRQL